MADFPNATTTGVRDGVTLTPSGSITINTAGAVVSDLDITGDVVINAPNVTLVDCKITGNVSFESIGGTMEYCDVIGRNSLNAVDINPNGHVGEGDNTTIRFCDISNAENGIWLEGQNALIDGNYIHFLQNNMGVPPSIAHIDGIQVPGTNIGATPLTSGTITDNTIDMTSFASTSAFISLDASNMTISANHLSGGAYTVYFLGNGHGDKILNNTIDSFAYGAWDVDPGTTTISGNIVGSTGQPFPGQDPGGTLVAGSISIGDVSITEGDSGTKVETFTVTRSGGTAAFDVNYATSDGTATVADGDYAAAANTLHFGSGVNTQTISVTVNGDTKVEGNESFNVNLSNATNGATISDNRGIGTITNDDGSSPAPSSNLVVNGGFETGTFGGWTLSGNSGGGQMFVDHGAPDAGKDDAAFGSFTRTDGVLTQLVPTADGEHYMLSFWTEPSSGTSPLENHFEAQWNGQVLMDVTNAPNSGYQQHTFDVVGAAGNSSLAFSGYNGPDAWHLDDVSVTHVVATAVPAHSDFLL